MVGIHWGDIIRKQRTRLWWIPTIPPAVPLLLLPHSRETDPTSQIPTVRLGFAQATLGRLSFVSKGLGFPCEKCLLRNLDLYLIASTKTLVSMPQDEQKNPILFFPETAKHFATRRHTNPHSRPHFRPHLRPHLHPRFHQPRFLRISPLARSQGNPERCDF